MHQPSNQLIKAMTEHNPINFDRTVAGFNITENGVQSYSKSIKLGPIQLTLNARSTGVRGSISIPGTGLSKRNIKLF
jgi:hypothetical protein